MLYPKHEMSIKNRFISIEKTKIWALWTSQNSWYDSQIEIIIRDFLTYIPPWKLPLHALKKFWMNAEERRKILKWDQRYSFTLLTSLKRSLFEKQLISERISFLKAILGWKENLYNHVMKNIVRCRRYVTLFDLCSNFIINSISTWLFVLKSEPTFFSI